MSLSDLDSNAESSLRTSWSIGPLRPWLIMIAQREMPDDLRGRVEASDIVQQTLLDAWKGNAGFRGTTHPQRLAWLRVILRRVLLENRRRIVDTQKRGEGGERVVTDAIAQSSLRIEQLAACEQPRPDEAVANAEQSLQVAEALQRLPDDYRRVILLRQFEHRSYDEIAVELNRSPAAARMLWVRALVELRQLLP